MALSREQVEPIIRQAGSMCPACLGAKDQPGTWDEQVGPDPDDTIVVKCAHRFHEEYAG